MTDAGEADPVRAVGTTPEPNTTWSDEQNTRDQPMQGTATHVQPMTEAVKADSVSTMGTTLEANTYCTNTILYL
jgi:hypothetical protein